MTSVSRDGMVEFRFYRPRVRQVSVVGDFNGWRKDALHMTSQGDGWWRAQLQLQQGDYRFRYLADETWFADYASHGVESEQHGWNSILVIPESANKAEQRHVRQVA